MSFYDPSQDYIQYPTLAPIPEHLRTSFAHCINCGCAEFLFQLPDWTAICKRCGQQVAVPGPQSVQSVPLHVRKTKPRLQIASRSNRIAVLRRDKTVRLINCPQTWTEKVVNWSDITAIAMGDYHLIGLRKDGTVTIIDQPGRCQQLLWSDITAIAAGTEHRVGLRKDGTVVADGSNKYRQCDVQDWTNIIAIDAGPYHTVGLRADGTVEATGSNKKEKCEVLDWTRVAAVWAGDNFTLAQRSNGSILCTDPEIKQLVEEALA